MTALKLVLYFIVLIAILCLAYYTTKLVGNGMGRKQDSGGIRVLERTVIARDSFLLIVEIQGTVMVLEYLLREYKRSAIWNPMNPRKIHRAPHFRPFLRDSSGNGCPVRKTDREEAGETRDDGKPS